MKSKRVWLCVVLCLFSLASFAIAADWKAKLPASKDVAQYLQDISVNVKAATGEGSGVIKTRQLAGQDVSFIWTAAHVVDSLRAVEEVIDNGGTKRQVVKFADAAIVKEETQQGRRIGESKMDVRVVRFSKDEDLALLQVRKRNYTKASVVFCMDAEIPPIGTRLLHVGSLLGQMGANSMTSGIQSQIGRVIEQREFEQSTVTAFPGSSGGGIYLENGAYVGMLVRGAGEQFNLYIPMRRMMKWAKRANIEWAIDDNARMPTEEEFDKLPIEDSGMKTVAASPTLAPSKPGTASILIQAPQLPRKIETREIRDSVH